MPYTICCGGLCMLECVCRAFRIQYYYDMVLDYLLCLLHHNVHSISVVL